MAVEVIKNQASDLVVFSEIEATINTLKSLNNKLVFNYNEPKGNKEARSHIFKLRQVKTQVNTIHQTAKADALAFGKRLDVKRNQLLGDIDEIIKVHEVPVKEIEKQEAAKVAAEQERIQAEKDAAETARLEAIRLKQEELDKRQAEIEAKEAAIKAADDKLKAEEAAREAEEERIEREKQIAKQAALDAEYKAKQALIYAENRRIAEAKAAEEKRLADIAKIKKEQEAKELAELKRKQAEEAEKSRLAAIEKKRIENEKHRAGVRAEAENAFVKTIGVSPGNAKELVAAIDSGKIRNVTINY